MPPLQGTWQVFERMRAQRLRPDRFTYTALITAAGAASDPTRLRQIYAEVLDSRGGPDGYVFSALFNSAAQCRGIDSYWLVQVSPAACSAALCLYQIATFLSHRIA